MDYAFHSHMSFVCLFLEYYITFLPEPDCPVFMWLASCSRSGEMPLASPHSATTLAFLANNVSADLTLL